MTNQPAPVGEQDVAAIAAAPVMMPIGDDVGWSNDRFAMGAQYENAAQRNHGQSLARLAERGGLSWCEAAAIVEMRPWFKMNPTAAEKIVRDALLERNSA